MKRRIALLAVAAAPSAIALIAAAFVSFASGSLSSPGPYGSTATASAPNGAAGAATADTPNSPLGRTVIDGKGRTLHPFEKDKQNGRGAPDGQCVSGEATYAGHPRPRFVEDGKQCETEGEGLRTVPQARGTRKGRTLAYGIRAGCQGRRGVARLPTSCGWGCGSAATSRGSSMRTSDRLSWAAAVEVESPVEPEDLVVAAETLLDVLEDSCRTGLLCASGLGVSSAVPSR